MAQVDTLQANITNTAQEYIKRMALIPVAYNVPQNELMSVFRLPAKGITLRVPRLRELAEAVDVWSSEIHLQASETGSQAINLDFDNHTIEKYGTYVRVSDKADFDSLLDLVEQVGRALTLSMAKTMNTKVYDNLAGFDGLQWMREGGVNTLATGEAEYTVAGTLSASEIRSDAATANASWDESALTFISGANAGLTRQVDSFLNANGAFTIQSSSVFPNVPAVGDKFSVCNLGAGTGVTNLATSDTMTLKELYRGLERCRRYGAGSLRFAGPTLTKTGIRRDNSADVANGVAFMPTSTAHDIKETLYNSSVAASQSYMQTSEGFRRAVGGQIGRIGGVLTVEVNDFKRATTAGILAKGAGVAFPTMILFQDAGGTTLLKDKAGKRQGLVSVMKRPGDNDTAVLYGSLKAQGEMWCLNKYFAHNALWGAIMWSGTTTQN